MINGIKTKTPSEIKIMIEGGKRLAEVKEKASRNIKEGVSAHEIDRITEEAILKLDGKPSFKMVPGYFWTTCVNTNEGVVHGIPTKSLVFKKNDVVSVDLGMYYKGLHTDTSLTVSLSQDKEIKKMLSTGKEALNVAIKEARAGNRIYDISKAIEDTLRKGDYKPIRALVGHGIGRELHEDPQIPCFVSGERQHSPEIPIGATLAIEVMYSLGSGDVVLEEDGWTISTHDDKISALYEETVAVTKNGPLVLTNTK